MKILDIKLLIVIGISFFGMVLVLSGCGGGNGNKTAALPPAADISGRWTGSTSDSSDTGSLEFLFVQSGSKITGTSNTLGSISGSLHHRTLTIDGTDFVGYLADDNETIRATYTAVSGAPITATITKED